MRVMGNKNAKTNELRLRKYYDENKDFYINNCKKLAESQRKPIQGISKDGDIISFESVNMAKENGFGNISSSIKRNGYCKGYRFKYI